MQIVGDHLEGLIPNNGTILTQCFGETIIGTVIRAAMKKGKNFRVFCAETRRIFRARALLRAALQRWALTPPSSPTT